MPTITYDWQPPTSGPPDGYNLYEGAEAGNETLLASVDGSVTSYTHARPYGPFAAYVKAVTAGVETDPGNEVTGTVKVQAPTITGLTRTEAGLSVSGI